MAELFQESNQTTWVEQIEIDHDNLRAALRWARDTRDVETGLKLVGALWRFWERQGHISEARQRLEYALIGSDKAALSLLAEAYTGAGTMAWHQNDYEHALIHHETALKQYQELQDKKGIAFALNNIGAQLNELGNYERAAVVLEESLTLTRTTDDRLLLAYVLHNLGETIKSQNRDYERAAALYQEALTIFRELEDEWAIAIELIWLGVLMCHLCNYEQAKAHFEESLSVGRRLNDKRTFALWLEGYGGLATVLGCPEQAARLWGAAETLRQETGVPILASDLKMLEPYILHARQTLGEDAYMASHTAGSTMTPEQAIAYARQGQTEL